MATTTSTTRATTTTFGLCAAESGRAGAFTLRAVDRAYLVCRRRKRGTRNAQRYEMRLLDNLVDTARALQQRAWHPSRSVCFVTTRPKVREIHAADFADRVVHHLLVPRLEALYEPVFIHDSYSNQPGKGTHAAVARLQRFMRQVTASGKRRGWYLQLDIATFFNRIYRPTLLALLARRLDQGISAGRIAAGGADDLRWLCRTILAEEPGRNVVRCGPVESFGKVPPHKRLGEAPAGRGLPIGNLTSQFFANVYLNELDQFVKHTLRCRHYLRYVDDFVLLHEDPAVLARWREQIESFLDARLGLALRDSGVLRPVSAGCDFLGYLVRPGYLLVRRRVVGHLREKLACFEGTLLHQGSSGVLLKLNKEPRERLRATLASYLGHFKHASSYRLRQALWRRFPWLGEIFVLNASGVLRPRWEPVSVTSLRSQWRYFRRQAPQSLVLLQVGNQAQIFDQQARWAAEVWGLTIDEMPRPGFVSTLSLPLGRLHAFRARLRRGWYLPCLCDRGRLSEARPQTQGVAHGLAPHSDGQKLTIGEKNIRKGVQP